MLRSYIAGSWQTPGEELSAVVCNANSGEVLFQQRRCGAAQVEAALSAADEAHHDGRWRQLGGQDRAAILREIAALLDQRRDDLATADALMTGVPIRYTRTIAGICAAAFRVAAELAEEPAVIASESSHRVERLPLGPAAIIGPWNAPSGIACHKLASALAAGCPVIFKPSEWAPASGQIVAEVIAELDLPHGVFQLLHGAGETGAAIVADERVAAVSFTGGLDAGRAVAASCASQIKPAQLELGGNNPLLILPGCDPDIAADGVVKALTTLNGQWCRALGRLIVHESLYEKVLEAARRRLAAIRIGDSLDERTEMGPLVHAGHREHVLQAIDGYRRRGARILQDAKLPSLAGWFVAPTLTTDIDPADCCDEIFGPVATAHSYRTREEAVELANRAPYGLAAYVFGEPRDALEVAGELETGMVKINSVTLLSPHPSAPRPAWKLSGIGDEGTRETFEFFRGTRVIGLPPVAAEETIAQ